MSSIVVSKWTSVEFKSIVDAMAYAKDQSLEFAEYDLSWEVYELKCEYKNGEFKSSSEPITAASIVPTLDQNKDN